MGQGGHSALPKYHTDMVTRQLCGHTYRDQVFATSVVGLFVTDRLRAHGQPLGIDLVAVTRHAVRARRMFLLRDAMLALCLAATLTGVAGGLAALLDRDGGRLGTCALLAGGALATGTVVVYAWGWTLWRAAQAVHWGDGAPREGAPPVRADLEEELDSLDVSDVVAYATAGQRAEHPFVGTGVYVMERVWAGIDVSRPAKDDQGMELTRKEFDAVDLHFYVAEHVGRLAGLDGLRARNRLHVRGQHAGDVPGLLPDRRHRPRTVLDDPACVNEGISETQDVMRTYLVLEQVGESGSYVVTVNVRARLVHRRLSWEISAYYLPPVHAFLGDDDTRKFGRVEQAWKLLVFTRHELRPQLFGSLHRVFGLPFRLLGQEVRRRRDLSRIARNCFDYGTAGTLRAAAADFRRSRDFTQQMDARDSYQRIQQGVLLATERFLKEHNVDASDLKEARATVNRQTYNFKGPISGQNIFGDHGINFASGEAHGDNRGNDESTEDDDKGAT